MNKIIGRERIKNVSTIEKSGAISLRRKDMVDIYPIHTSILIIQQEKKLLEI